MKRKCAHEFLLVDLKQTGMPEPAQPAQDAGSEEWELYYDELHNGEHHMKRVAWPCRKCGKVFYAHCGLDISPKHGFIVQPNAKHKR
jgi:hypothetical protein